jgi:SnoaL-like protein
MVNARRIAALSLAVGVLAVVVAAQEKTAQQITTAGLTKSPSLTAMDYIEIQQLLARYGFALDTGADNGYMYADLYTPDGVFGRSKGREELAALARGGRRGPLNVRNMGSYGIIRPSPEGATGIQYAQAINFAERDKNQPTELDHFGHYEDVYVKTAEGWRFKSRTFVNESGSLKPQSQRTAATTAEQPR